MTSRLLTKDEKILDKFLVNMFLGEMPNSVIYRISDESGKKFLLKLSENEINEAILLKGVTHSNIERYTDSGILDISNEKYYYMITEYISGENIYEKIRREGALPSIVAIPIVSKVLEALIYLHTKSSPIIHNSVTLKSIILDYAEKEDNPYLTDFSNARNLGQKISYIEAENHDPFYCAPEVYKGIMVPESDIYSAGVLLYNLMSNKPFTMIDFRNEKHRENLIDAELSNLALVDNLKTILKKSLATDYKKRFSSAEDFKNALLSKDFKIIEPKKRKGKGFADIAGMDDLKELLYNDVIKALNEKDLYKSYGLTIPNGILLYGPPGCGKTYIAEKFSEEISFNMVSIKPSDIASTYVHGTQQKIGNLFKEAEEKKPSIIFLDEVDAMVPKREGGELNRHYDAEVNEFLSQMSNCSEKDIFVIATSNRPEIIDPAILRTGRIDRVIYVPPPDEKARSQMFELYLKNRPIANDLNYDELSISTNNFVSSDIKFIVDEASRKALKNKEKISQVILIGVIKNFNPSVNLEQIKALKDYKKNEEKKKRRIGFAANGD